MARNTRSLAAARQTAAQLHQLNHAPAPPTILPRVLVEVGLGDFYTEINAPIGSLFVAYNKLGISAVSRTHDPAQFERTFRARFGRAIHWTHEPPQSLVHAITQHLEGQPNAPLRFDLRGLSEFERAVLLKAREIPRGEVRPYAWIAQEIDRPKAVRAVGSALAGNPVPLLIPCHRVVRTDGHIGNYIFGSSTKRALLELEGAAPELIERLAQAGVRFYGDPSDHTFCLPTCAGLHRRTDRRLISFRSGQAAIAAGFEPCQTCRPVRIAA